MSYGNLNAVIRARVPRTMRAELRRIAQERHLEVSDIIREAVREYVESKRPKSPQAIAS